MSIDAEELVRAFEIIDKKRREAAEEEQRKELRVQMENLYATEAQKARISLKKDFLDSCRETGRKVSTAVGRYEHEQYKAFLQTVDKTAAIPVGIDYDKLFSKLTRLKSRESLVKGVRQILSKTREIVNAYEPRDLSLLYHNASIGYAKALHDLENVVVIEPKKRDNPKQEAEANLEQDRVKSIESEFASLADEALDDVFLELSKPDPTYFEQLKDVEPRVNALLEAKEKATKQLEAIKRASAEKIVGQSIYCEDIVPFEGVVEMRGDISKDQLFTLLGLVEAAARTYNQVVLDNGLFAAFPVGNRGSKYVGDSKVMARSVIIPEAFLVDNGGNHDDIEMTIEIMTEMSKRRYFGMLDDDFTYFIDLFWYGFAKLAEFMSKALSVDASEVRQYFEGTHNKLKKRAQVLGFQMCDEQARAYENALKKLLKKQEKRQSAAEAC